MSEGSNFLSGLLIGGISATIATTAFAPLERVKLLLQTQDANIKILDGTTKRYNGIINCFSRIFREEGAIALFRGNLASVLKFFPSKALSFALRDLFKDMFGRYDPSKE